MSNEESNQCEVCLTNQTILQCDVCGIPSCKQCSSFLHEDMFEFMPEVPEELNKDRMCPNCFEEVVEPQLEKYNQLVEQAEAVNVYMKHQGKETRLIRRIEKPIKVSECADQEEALMRLAYLAAEKGYDTIIDVELTSKKAGKNSYKKLTWDGKAVPCDPSRRK